MGAGGYAQNALATLFTEQFRNQGAIGPNDNPRNLQELTDAMANNKARQEGLIPNQELVEQYTPESTPVGETTEDVTRRFVEGTGAVPQSRDISTGLASLEQKIADERDKLSGLTITETEEKTRPKYEVSYPTTSMYQTQKPATYTSTLPKGATLQRGQYGQQFYQKPSSDPFLRPYEAGPMYRKVGDEKYTVTNVRDAIAGDDIYDKQMNLVNQLQRQYDVRSKYASPNATGIQGLIADPVASQPQTGYNNINEIMKRYLG